MENSILGPENAMLFEIDVMAENEKNLLILAKTLLYWENMSSQNNWNQWINKVRSFNSLFALSYIFKQFHIANFHYRSSNLTPISFSKHYIEIVLNKWFLEISQKFCLRYANRKYEKASDTTASHVIAYSKKIPKQSLIFV